MTSAEDSFLESLLTVKQLVKYWLRGVDYGKFAPEARRFTLRKLDALLAKLEALESEL